MAIQMEPPASARLAAITPNLERIAAALEQATPALQQAHSLHWEALQNPAVARNRAFREFTQNELWELHAAISLAGFIRRVLAGEATPATLAALASDMALFLQMHRAAQAALQAATRSPAVAAAPAVARMAQTLQRIEPAVQSIAPVMAQTLTYLRPA